MNLSNKIIRRAIVFPYRRDNLLNMSNAIKPPPGQHPLVEPIRARLVTVVNDLNDRDNPKRLTIAQIADMCGMSFQFIASFKTNKRCVQDFPLDTFFKLTDGLKMSRAEMVKGVQDILSPKIEKSLNGPYRTLMQKFLECLEDSDPNQIEILENLINTIHRQSDEIDPPQKQQS